MHSPCNMLQFDIYTMTIQWKCEFDTMATHPLSPPQGWDPNSESVVHTLEFENTPSADSLVPCGRRDQRWFA